MHHGRAYHEFMLASPQDARVRGQFQNLVYQFTSYEDTIFDFGAGTGIDAKAYAEKGFRVLVYEPDSENRAYLTEYCSDELKNGDIAIAGLAANGIAQVITADFAVLNLIADQSALFQTFENLLASKGHVVVNLLNPFFVGDARYAWWWRNFHSLRRRGSYVVEGNDGPIYRFIPSAVARAAQPGFRQVAFHPDLLGLAVSQYMFMVFQKKI